MDRRIKRTRRAIFQAFLAMVKDKPVNKISVSELTELADINRKTFYLHFSDIFALEEFIIKMFTAKTEDLKEYFSVSNLSMNDGKFVDVLFDKLDSVSSRFKGVTHTDFFHNLLREAIENLRRKIIEEYVKRGGINIHKLSYAYTFISGGITELFLDWANAETLDDKQMIKDILNEIIDFEYLSLIAI